MTLAFKALKANKLKTFLIYLSLVFSITAIFLISSISNGIISMYSSLLKTDSNIIITQAKISDTFFSDVDIKLKEEIKKIKNVKDVSALIVGASPLESLPIVAVYGASKNRIFNYKLIKGTYPKENEILIGEGIYNSLKNKKQVELANKKYLISGIYKSEIGFENGGVVLNIKEAGKIFNKSASMLLVNTDINSNINVIIEKIKKLDSKIEAKSTQNFIDNYNQFKIIQTSSNIVSLIAFLMGLLSIVSIMSITINQRKSEFGIKRAIGISMEKIVIQIINESFILGLFAYLSSLAISYLVLFFIKNSSHLQGYVNGEISTDLAIYIFLTSLAMTILGSIIPALNAAKTDPIILIQGNKI